MSEHGGKTVSVIIPVYQDQHGLDRCLEALSRQSFPAEQMEVLVVDNGSEPPVRVDHFRGRLNLRLIQCRRKGAYAARNAGVMAASGRILAFTDADCMPENEWIAAGVSALDARAGRAFVGGEVSILRPERPTAVALYQSLIGFDQKFNIEEKRFTATANLFCTREHFEQVGLFEETLLSGGDREWCWRAQKKGFDLIYQRRAAVSTSPRITLKSAIRQARRVTAGRWMLQKLGLAHVGETGLAKKRSALESVRWILNHRELTIRDRIRVLAVAVMIRLAESVEKIRLCLGAEAERL